MVQYVFTPKKMLKYRGGWEGRVRRLRLGGAGDERRHTGEESEAEIHYRLEKSSHITGSTNWL